MNEIPANKLDPRIKTVWRICYAIPITIVGIALIVAAVLINNSLASEGADLGNLPYIIIAILLVILYVIFLGILPTVRYRKWRYEITDDCLDVMKGGFFKKRRYLVPFISVQDTDTRQGVLLNAFKLAAVTVSTAANEHVIPGLAVETAEQLRNRVAELAASAREDA
jgi:membrane protein YdbS with pleckstrin-like domain